MTLLCILCFCGANSSMYLSETPTSLLAMLNYLLTLVQPGICRSIDLSSRLSDFFWLVSSMSCSYLLTDLLLTVLSCQLSQGPFFPHPLPVLWAISFHAITDKGILWLALTPTETNATHHVTPINMGIRAFSLYCLYKVVMKDWLYSNAHFLISHHDVPVIRYFIKITSNGTNQGKVGLCFINEG